jgi:hypothetical protein
MVTDNELLNHKPKTKLLDQTHAGPGIRDRMGEINTRDRWQQAKPRPGRADTVGGKNPRIEQQLGR